MATEDFLASPASSTPCLKPVKAKATPPEATAERMAFQPVKEKEVAAITAKLHGLKLTMMSIPMVSRITTTLKRYKIKLKRTKPLKLSMLIKHKANMRTDAHTMPKPVSTTAPLTK